MLGHVGGYGMSDGGSCWLPRGLRPRVWRCWRGSTTVRISARLLRQTMVAWPQQPCRTTRPRCCPKLYWWSSQEWASVRLYTANILSGKYWEFMHAFIMLFPSYSDKSNMSLVSEHLNICLHGLETPSSKRKLKSLGLRNGWSLYDIQQSGNHKILKFGTVPCCCSIDLQAATHDHSNALISKLLFKIRIAAKERNTKERGANQKTRCSERKRG